MKPITELKNADIIEINGDKYRSFRELPPIRFGIIKSVVIPNTALTWSRSVPVQ